MTMQRTCFLFAGPSRHGTRYQSTPMGPDAGGRPLVWLPPARRGDAQRLVEQQPQPGILALADGTFHSYPAIGHIELRQAMERGWIFVGLCSMGAIRSCEMQHLGARPWGRVAAMFCENPALPDDEVALVHGAEAPWLPLSEPLIHLREYLRRMVVQGIVPQDVADAAAESLRTRWYGERTLPALRAELQRGLAGQPALARALAEAADFRPYRLKQQDLEAFVDSEPWRLPADAGTGTA